MSRLIVFCSCVLLFSCKKNEQVSRFAGYFGQWQFIGYNWGGPGSNTPPPDSVVVLSLIKNNTYQISLNGQVADQGTFSIDSGSNGRMLTFNDVIQSTGNSVIVGQLTLFRQNDPLIYGDSLVLVQEPIGFEWTTNYFRKLP